MESSGDRIAVSSRASPRGTLAAAWGLLGLSSLLLSAVYRLSLRAFEALATPLDWYHWLSLVVCLLLMAYSEGYRGFQQGFSPRAAVRVRYLCDHASWLETVLAPLFVLSYFHAQRRRQIISLVLTLLIVCLVLVVRLIPQPWRGIIDLGVVVGLTWGVLSFAVCVWKELRRD